MQNVSIEFIFLLILTVIIVLITTAKRTKKKTKQLRGIASVTNNGERVKSKAEARIANALKKSRTEYLYEKTIFLDGQKIKPDFYLPKYNLYIEYFGWYKVQKNYTATAKRKKKLYKAHQIKTWYLYPKDYKILEKRVHKKIFWLKFWYGVKRVFGMKK